MSVRDASRVSPWCEYEDFERTELCDCVRVVPNGNAPKNNTGSLPTTHNRCEAGTHTHTHTLHREARKREPKKPKRSRRRRQRPHIDGRGARSCSCGGTSLAWECSDAAQTPATATLEISSPPTHPPHRPPESMQTAPQTAAAHLAAITTAPERPTHLAEASNFASDTYVRKGEAGEKRVGPPRRLPPSLALQRRCLVSVVGRGGMGALEA